MEIPLDTKSFYKSQRDVADALNSLIDSYWNNEISEDVLIKSIRKISNNNKSKVFKDGHHYPAILLQRCGKRRLNVISKILGISEE